MNPAQVAADTVETLRVVRASLDVARRQRRALARVWDDLLALTRLVASWARGDYAAVPWRSVLLAIGALLYFLDPFDVVPDQLPLLGYVDDGAVIAFVVNAIRADLVRFAHWETTRSAKAGARSRRVDD